MKSLKCLKIINKKPNYSSNTEISNTENYVSIEDRFDEHNLRYIKRSLANNNELIIDLLSHFRAYSSSRALANQTLFSNTSLWCINREINFKSPVRA